jgi:anti-sigma factor RsiW
MNCTATRDQLAGFVYGDLEPNQAAHVQAHLDGCPACRQELAALKNVRQMLDTVPAPAMAVDLPALYRELAERQTRGARRWRRSALVFAAVAALLLMALALPVHLGIENSQLTVRWGSPEPIQPIAARPSVPSIESRSQADEEQVRLLRELVHALQRDTDSRDLQRQQDLVRLQARIIALQRQMDQQRTETQENVNALYILAQKGN